MACNPSSYVDLLLKSKSQLSNDSILGAVKQKVLKLYRHEVANQQLASRMFDDFFSMHCDDIIRRMYEVLIVPRSATVVTNGISKCSDGNFTTVDQQPGFSLGDIGPGSSSSSSSSSSTTPPTNKTSMPPLAEAIEDDFVILTQVLSLPFCGKEIRAVTIFDLLG